MSQEQAGLMGDGEMAEGNTALMDGLNAAIREVDGVNALLPPHGALRSMTERYLAWVRKDEPPPVQTVALEVLNSESGQSLSVLARVVVNRQAATPEVAAAVARAARHYVYEQVSQDVHVRVKVEVASIS